MKKNIIYVDFVKKRKISHFHYVINRFIYYIHNEFGIRQIPSNDIIVNKPNKNIIGKLYYKHSN